MQQQNVGQHFVAQTTEFKKKSTSYRINHVHDHTVSVILYNIQVFKLASKTMGASTRTGLLVMVRNGCPPIHGCEYTFQYANILAVPETCQDFQTPKDVNIKCC